MSSFPATSFLKEIKSGGKISEGDKAYFRERLRNRLFSLIVGEYARQRADGTLSQVEVARRLARSPVQVSRWLGAPGNWTIDTISDLLLAISAAELDIGVRRLEPSLAHNHTGPDWLAAKPSSDQISVKVTNSGFSIPPVAIGLVYKRVSK